MSACYTAAYPIPSAKIGQENPLPDIKNISYIHADIETTDAVPPELTQYVNKGMIDTMLPYGQQDDYGRERTERIFQAIVLENELLKAVFLPELGGRLWSLTDKTTGRELLYRNPVFQPGNLALRNAWFSGGVEFNVSIKGHHPMTCSSMFAQRIEMADGTPGVRMYEYERIRGTAYGFDAWLPDGSAMLYVRPRIENTTDHPVWTYWWSNIAVPYTEKMRVIVPAEKTFVNYGIDDHYYLDFAGVPVANGIDITYPKNVKIAQDFFFYIPDEARKWIAAVDEKGLGLMQCSTRQLKGRKLFVWGDSRGGDNWKDFLSDGQNDGYIEIQAGLARTQLEHIPLEAGGVYTWVEAYGALEQDPGKLHGQWQDAQDAVLAAFDASFGKPMEQALDPLVELEAKAGDPLFTGSGWGTLEQLRRQADGEADLSPTYRFPESALEPAQMPWLMLLQQGKLPCPQPNDRPGGYVVDKQWHRRLENALEQEENRTWYSWMHAGIMRYADGQLEAARAAFENSQILCPNPWALRNLAMLWRNEFFDNEKALAYMEQAIDLQDDNRWLWIDMATTCLTAKAYTRWIALYGRIPAPIRTEGRLKLYTAMALTELGELEEAAEYLNYDLVIPDLKEGENLISDAWFALHSAMIRRDTGITDPELLKKMVEEQYPLNNLDFRMH